MHPAVDCILFLLRLPLWYLQSGIQYAMRRVWPKRKDISGQVAIVTGAASGIGQALCVRLAARGCHVAAWDVNADGLEKTRRLVAAAASAPSVRYEAFRCDLGNRDECYATAEATLRRMGRVDLAINNAGIVNGQRLLDLSDEQIDRLYRINLFSHYWLTKALLPHLLARGTGHFVFTASCTAWMGASHLTDYSPSKAADLIFAEALQSELRGCYPSARIAVTALAPSFVNTGMFDGCESRLDRLFPALEPDYVADRALEGILAEEFLVSMPLFVSVFVAMKALLPPPAFLAMQRLCDMDTFMHTYQGAAARSATPAEVKKGK